MLQKTWVKIVLGILAVIVSLGIYTYASVLRPLIALGRGIEKLSDHDSMQIKYQAPDEVVEIVGSLAGKIEDGKLSSVEFVTKGVSAEMRVGKEDLFVQANYEEMDKLGTSLREMDPMILRTKTYTQLLPMMSNKAWLHFELPDKWWESEDSADFEMDSQAGAKVVWNVLRTVKIKSYDKAEGKIVMSLRKQGMLALIEDMKDMEIDVKLSQINALKRIVESSDEWDSDLLEFYLDKEGRLVKIVARLPEIDKEVLSESMKAGLQDEKGVGQAASSFTGGIAAYFSKGETKYMELGSVTISNFDEVATIERPEAIVEWESWSKTAMAEFGPLIMQVMGSALNQPQPSSYAPTGKNMAPGKVKNINNNRR